MQGGDKSVLFVDMSLRVFDLIRDLQQKNAHPFHRFSDALDDEAVRAQLADNLSGALVALIPAEVPVSEELLDSVATNSR